MPFIQFQFRRDTADNWASANPTLADGEIGIESDTGQFKIGNGLDNWTTRPYGGIQGDAGPAGPQGEPGANGIDANPDAVINGLLNITLNSTGDFIPGTDILQDLGSPTNRFRHVYVGPGSVYIGDNVITQAATGGLILPGVTRATGYYADDVDDEDQWGSNPVISGTVTVIDATRYEILAGQTPSANYSPAIYTVEKDDNRIDSVNIDVGGSGWTKSEADYARDNNMYATNVTGAIDNFNASDWVQIPFRVEIKAEDIEYEDMFGGGADLGSFTIDGNSLQVSSGTDIYVETYETGGDGESRLVLKPQDNGEENPSRIEGSYSVGIWANNTDSDNTHKWLFGTDGNLKLPAGGDIVDSNGTSVLGGSNGSGLPTITVPGEQGTTYKGLQVSYGMIHSNGSSFEYNVNKIVIYKPSVAVTTIDPTSSDDDFQVSGLGDSDVLAMFVLYGDTNGPKLLSTLQAFAETVIDSVILAEGQTGVYNTVDQMKTLFYSNYQTLASVADGLYTNFQFFIGGINNNFIVSADLSGQGSGSGFAVYGLSYNMSDNTVSVIGYDGGLDYVVGDVIVITGTSIQDAQSNPLATPDNDITITVTGVSELGQVQTFTVTGTLPRPTGIWPTNNIGDGGADQYDTANYISTNLATEISYNNGETVEDGTGAFGEGSSYSFVYDTAIFGLFATGSSATLIRTSGGSGADGDSITIAGNIYGPDTPPETYNNAVSYINIVSNIWAGPIVSFTHADYGDEVDILIADDGDGAGVGITRDTNNGIYNPYREGSWDSDVSPGGTLWNTDGWADFTDVETRTYLPLYAAFGFGGLGNKIVGAECVMYLPDNDKYYAVKFDSWTQNGNGGGFAYTRREIDVNNLQEGIRFSDGTVLKSAEGVGRVKLESPGSRRIEEAYGYKQVSVTAKNTINLTATASRSANGEYRFWVDSATTTIDDVLNDTVAAGIVDTTTIQFSLDNNTWYTFGGGTSFDGTERGYGVSLPVQNLNYSVGDTVYFRYQTGGAPVVWWSSADLPGGSSNFRGAIIDYHAYTGDSTIIGTIHIVDDDGEENITHTEVSSGSTDGENDDLWYVTNEGQIKYRRLDGNSSTLKVQWTAKVFYGSETND
jgi:hypothetical protein